MAETESINSMTSVADGGASSDDQSAGEYKGHYYDILGYRGEIRFSLTGEKNLSGDCEITLSGNHAPLIFRGSAEIFFQPSSLGDLNGIMRLNLELEDEDPSEVELPSEGANFSSDSAMTIRSASPYAQRAMYGVIPPGPAVGLGGGVWIAWRFATSK